MIESLSGPSAALQQLIIKSAEERKDLHEEAKEERKGLFSIIAKREEALERSFDRERETVGKSFTFGIIGIVSAVGIMIFFLYIILHYISARREAAMMQYQERMMRVMQEQSVALIQGAGGKGTPAMLTASTAEVNTREMIASPNPHIRAKGVELLENELLKEEEDADVAVRLLAPFLKDEDNRVRANAAKAIHRYEPQMALSVLREMMNSPDKWMHGSALWALGEIKSSESAEILLECLRKEELNVSIGHQIRATLIKILHFSKEISTELRANVEAEMIKDSKRIEPGVIVEEEKEKEERSKEGTKEENRKGGKGKNRKGKG